MKQLTGLDAGFLYLESKTTYGHITGLAVCERPSDDYKPFDRIYARFEALVGHIAPLRRRLVEVPFNLDLPYWIDDPHFDLGYHVRHLGLAPPGTIEQLGDQIARIVSRPMDRSRPLWESYVIEGLPDNRWALLTKTHHSSIDGAAGVLLLNMLADTEAEPEAPLQPVSWSAEPMPSDLGLLLRTLSHAAVNPVKGLQMQAKLARELGDQLGITGWGAAAGRAANLATALARLGQDTARHESPIHIPAASAPPTPWNKPISAQRRFAMRSVSLADLKALKNATGGTVNDIVMAICAGALRRYLLEHDALPDAPLRAMVPVSIRDFTEEEPWTNRVSAMIAELPTNLDDPLERLAKCHDSMDSAKHQFGWVPTSTLIEASQYAPSVIAASVFRLARGLVDKVTPPVNVVISNVPGPREPLYLGGAKMVAYAPVSIVTDGLGLNITVHSYLDRVEIGIISDRELVPDLWRMVDLHVEEVDVLFEATGARRDEAESSQDLTIVGDAEAAVDTPLIPAEPPSPEGADAEVADATEVEEETTPAGSATPDEVADEKAAAEEPAAKKAVAKKSSAKKSSVKKAAAKKAAAKKPSAKKRAAKKKAKAKKAATEKPVAEKSSAKKPSGKKAGSARKSAAKKSSAKKPPAKKAAVDKPPAKKPVVDEQVTANMAPPPLEIPIVGETTVAAETATVATNGAVPESAGGQSSG